MLDILLRIPQGLPGQRFPFVVLGLLDIWNSRRVVLPFGNVRWTR